MANASPEQTGPAAHTSRDPRPLASLDTPSAAFVGLLARGFWPVGIYPAGVKLPGRGDALTQGKEPFGKAWGLERWTVEQWHSFIRVHPEGGCGVCLGPGRAPDGGWLIDAEGDGPDAEESRAKLLGGELLETLGWGSVRGGHQLLTADGERLKAIVATLKPFQVKGQNQPGVFHIPALPGLELRCGGYHADGTVKQLQSVVPPTPGTNGEPRQWNDVETVAPLPESFYATVEAIAGAAAHSSGPGSDHATDRPSVNRADTWLKRALENGCGRIANAADGSRHSTLMSETRTLAGYVHYWDECRIGFSEAELAREATAAGDRAAPERTGDNARCIADAIANGKAEPLELSPDLHRVATSGASQNSTGHKAESKTRGAGPPPGEQNGAKVGFLGIPPQPRPIRVTLRPVPPMAPELIPEPFREWLADIAERACCPLDLPAVGALVAIGAVVGRRIGIRPKQRDDWTVVPNLWGMGVLPPGYLKTHCLEETTKPLVRLEMEARDQHAHALADFEVEKLIAESKATAAAVALKEATKKKAPESELKRLAAEALVKPDKKPPTLKRYIVNDVTVEKLGELLTENPKGLLQFRDELMGWLKTLEKQGHESDRAFYLESWNGTGAFNYDRIGRGHLHIPFNTMSILGNIQPGRLANYIRSTASGVNDDGLICRFQLAVYPDVDQPFVNVDRWPDTEAKNGAFAVFQWLDALDPVAIGAILDDSDTRSIPYLRFAEDTQGFFDEWRTDLENRVRSSQESACLTSHLSKYRSLMPSLALLFHLIDVAAGATPAPVSLESARRAAAWCDYLEAHARRIYQGAFDGDPEPAQRLGERLKASLPDPFTVRQVVQKGWTGLTTTEDVERAVAILEEHDWLRRVEVPPGPEGGRPRQEIHINPLVHQEAP
jgi:putative DNA primase/helicase